MSENSPELNMNGHGGALTDSARWSDGVSEAAADLDQRADVQDVAESGRSAVVDDLCRLTVCGPARSVELAVPVHVPLIDLLPALVGHLGDDLADAGLEHGGWVLQRLGDPPLREDVSIAALGLHDGDVVHLRPRSDQLPPLDFDDLIDGIAVGISGRADRWRPEMSRRLLVGLLAAPLAAGLVLLVGRLSPLADLLAATMTVVLVTLAAVASRAFGDSSAAGVLGLGAIACAGVAGAELPMLHAGAGGHALAGWSVLRAALMAGASAAAGMSAAVTMLTGGRRPLFVGTTAATLLVAVGGGLAAFGKLGVASVAGLLVAVILPLGGWVPVLSFRLARLRLDPTPTTPEELQDDLDPVPGKHVLERTRWADRYMAALYWGLAVPVGSSLVVLGLATGWPAHVVSIDAIVLMLLHARVLVAARHRLAAVIPAVCGAAVLITAAGLRADVRTWPVLVAALIVALGLIFAGERALPGHKLLPHWGRAGDVFQTMTAVGLIPATLWLLNLYHVARTAHG